jgi:hypothetical protein
MPHVTVTRMGNRVSIHADNVDVQTVLVRLFMKMDRQLTVDQAVSGPVSLHLTAVPFDVALKTVCRQAHLTYQYSRANSIYSVYKAPMAARRRAGGGQSAEFSGESGNDEDIVVTVLPGSSQQPQQQPSTPQDQPVPGIPGGVPNSGNYAGVVVQNPAPNGVLVIGHLTPGSVAVSQGAFAVGTTTPTSGVTGGYGATGLVGGYGPGSGTVGTSSPMNTNMAPMPQGYPVYFDVPDSRPAPLAGLLTRLGREAGIPVAIDDSAAANANFAITGHISPRNLARALDTISTAAHITWKWNGYEVVISAPANARAAVLRAMRNSQTDANPDR